MIQLQERLSEAMRARSLDIRQLAQEADVAQPDIERWLEKGQMPGRKKAERVARVLQVTMAYLMNWDSMYPHREEDEAAYVFQAVGAVTLRNNHEIEEEYIDVFETIPQSWLLGDAPEAFFVYQAGADALTPVVLPEDLLLCRRAPVVDNNSVGVVIFRGSAMLRIIEYNNDGTCICLKSFDDEEPDIRVEGEALADCHIIGHVIRVIREMP